MLLRIVFYLVLASFFITPAQAQEKADFSPDFSKLKFTGEATVDQVIDPLRLKLLDQRIVQLTGLDIPDLTPYDTGDIGMAVMDMLKEKLEKKTIQLYQTKKADKGRMNRMGYQLAHITLKNSGEWMQGTILSEGLARVRPSTLHYEMATQMQTIENTAREEQKGLWALDDYKVLTPETAQKALHDWAIIEGTVRTNAMAGNTVYLNFGLDWRKDFTIGIPRNIRQELVKQGVNPLKYTGRTVRVRGWVEKYNGPYVELMHPVWLEVINKEKSTQPGAEPEAAVSMPKHDSLPPARAIPSKTPLETGNN